MSENEDKNNEQLDLDGLDEASGGAIIRQARPNGFTSVIQHTCPKMRHRVG